MILKDEKALKKEGRLHLIIKLIIFIALNTLAGSLYLIGFPFEVMSSCQLNMYFEPLYLITMDISYCRIFSCIGMEFHIISNRWIHIDKDFLLRLFLPIIIYWWKMFDCYLHDNGLRVSYYHTINIRWSNKPMGIAIMHRLITANPLIISSTINLITTNYSPFKLYIIGYSLHVLRNMIRILYMSRNVSLNGISL